MTNDFSLYNNFNTAVLVVDLTGKIVYKNIPFVRLFGNVKNLAKFVNYFNFDICILNPENILEANPISFAMNSKENFTAYTTYQKTKDQFLNFRINSFFHNNHKVIAFHDITAENAYTELQNNYGKLQKNYQNILKENKDFATFQQKAQTQAIKMAIMHRVSNVIRESINISKIIDSALKELFNLYGAIKVYYARSEEKHFVIEHVYPAKYKTAINTKFTLEEDAAKDILSKQIRINPCIREFIDSEQTYAATVTRIIVPVYRLQEFLGVVIIFIGQKNITDPQTDVLQSIATQLATAIVQASLFEQITKKNNELQNTLNELKETQLQLINSEKMASLGQLVAGVAHEINTPLASINSNNDIAGKLIQKLDKNRQNSNIIDTIQKINYIDAEAIKRISGIVKSLKRFVRLDEADLQFADINKELDLTLELIKHETKNKINIIRDYQDIPQIKCYPNMLNQVFMNILVNACQSIEENGEIKISTFFKDNNLIVKIKDNGCGIEDEMKDKIFSAGSTTKKIGIGTGLGLAISLKIIEKHKGIIEFTSQKGKGSEFIIKIPQTS